MIAKGQTSGKGCRKLNSRNPLQVRFFTLTSYRWFQRQSGKMDKTRFPPRAVINSTFFLFFLPSCYKQAEMLHRADALWSFMGVIVLWNGKRTGKDWLQVQK